MVAQQRRGERGVRGVVAAKRQLEATRGLRVVLQDVAEAGQVRADESVERGHRLGFAVAGEPNEGVLLNKNRKN